LYSDKVSKVAFVENVELLADDVFALLLQGKMGVPGFAGSNGVPVSLQKLVAPT